MINAADFFVNFIAIGKKAAEIAKLIRYESGLFDLLIEEKRETFYLQRDYKTFSDVLIQETVRNDLKAMKPNLSNNLFGEESNEFTNKLNINIKIKIGETLLETKELIMKVLDGHEILATKLVSLIHGNLNDFIDESILPKLKVLQDVYIEISDLGIWIDPIDATAEYINGRALKDSQNFEHYDATIKNVTVLIGSFSLKTGIPFIGVVYQPFSQYDSNREWKDSCFWGIKKDNVSLHSDNIKKRLFTFPAMAMTSLREVDFFSDQLNQGSLNSKWKVNHSAGAGFKFLLMFEGNCDCYILSKGSTYKWDTCGPHAILLAMGGGVVNYQEMMKDLRSQVLETQCDTSFVDMVTSSLVKYQLSYEKTGTDDCNSDGFLAYSSLEVAMSVIDTFLTHV